MEIEMIPATKEEVEAVRKTLKMWRWLANHPGMGKLEFLDTIPPLDWPGNDWCYLCDEWGKFECDGCPLDSELTHCALDHSPFERWVQARESRKRGKEWDTTTPALEIIKILEDWLGAESTEGLGLIARVIRRIKLLLLKEV